MPYSAFKEEVFKQFDANVGIKSMAYKQKEEYSKFAHGHNYTDFRFYPSYGPNSFNSADIAFDGKSTIDYTDPANC